MDPGRMGPDFGFKWDRLLLSTLDENQQPTLEAGATFQAQSDNIQGSSDPLLNSGLSGFSPFQPSLSVLSGRGPSSARTSARPRVAIKMISPVVLDERPIVHRRDVQLKLEISVSAEPLPFGVDPPEYCIKVPRTKSVKRSGSLLGRTVLDFRLEVLGATTGSPLMFACHKCSLRDSPSSPNLSMVDFVSKEDVISVQQGKASIAFRFLCPPIHHGTMDEEYKLSAVVSERDQVLERHTFPNWLRVVSHLRKRRNLPPATISQGTGTSMVMKTPVTSAGQGDISNPSTLGPSYSGTSAGEDQHSEQAQSQSPAVGVYKESEPARQQSPLQTPAAPVNERVAEAGPELSCVYPRRGPTSGGGEIGLLVSNLPPTVKLYARFGCNITHAAHVAPGVLSCLLPPSAHPGLVNVTLCQAPSTNAEPYGRSLASFEYEADSAKAVSLILKLFNGKLLLEYMPLIQRLLQRDAGSRSLEVEPGPLDSNMPRRSSLPESTEKALEKTIQYGSLLSKKREWQRNSSDRARVFEILKFFAVQGSEGSQNLAQDVIVSFAVESDASGKARLLDLVDTLVAACDNTFHQQLAEEGFFQALISDEKVQTDLQFRAAVRAHLATWLRSLSGKTHEIASDVLRLLSDSSKGEFPTDRQHERPDPSGPSDQPFNCGPREVLTFQTPKLEKALCKFLWSSYIQAGDILRKSRRVKRFSLQSIHIARQAFHLIIRFNDFISPDGPTNEQYDEGMELDDALEELEDKIDELGKMELDEAHRCEEDHKYDLARLYQIFFATRDFYPNGRDYKTDPVLKRLVDLDYATLTLARHSRQQ